MQVNITKQTCYRWKKQYGGMGIDQLKDLKKLRRAVTEKQFCGKSMV